MILLDYILGNKCIKYSNKHDLIHPKSKVFASLLLSESFGDNQISDMETINIKNF